MRQGNLGLLMDVELDVRLQFGCRQTTLREVLELATGAVLELDREIQEPVDLLLNGRVVARGEVVVVMATMACGSPRLPPRNSVSTASEVSWIQEKQMPVSLRSVLPGSLPITGLTSLPTLRPPALPASAKFVATLVGAARRHLAGRQLVLLLGLLLLRPLRRLEKLAEPRLRRTPRVSRLPLGLILLSQGAITAEQLRLALAMQRSARRGKIGEWLVGMGAVAEEQVTNALAAQQGCPVFAPRDPQALPAAMHWPKPLTEIYRAMPVFYNPAQSALYVGFLEGVDHAFLYSVERMLQCRTDPCIVPPAVFRQNLELRPSPRSSETIVIHQRQNSFEMAQAINNYAQQVRAQRCLLTLCGAHLWIRLRCPTRFHVDFLFRAPGPSVASG